MKFIVFYELCPENLDKVRARGEEWVKERKQNPGKYGRYMLLQDGTGIGFAMIGKYKGFNLSEYDTEEQMQNGVEFWAPLLKLTYIPIRQTPGAQQG
jgi:hypothetical protein